LNRMKEYDIAVLGAGPGGYVAAIWGARLGASVALIEKDRIGGTCLNRGCIPTKVMTEAAEILKVLERTKGFGIITSNPEVDWERLASRRDEVVSRLRRGLETILKARNIDLIFGTGSLRPGGGISVERGDGSRTEIKAKKIVIATGSIPSGLPGIEIDEDRVMTSDGALKLTSPPKSLLVIGGGIIGCELGWALRKLGSKEVTIVEVLQRILPNEDPDVSRIVTSSLEREGVRIMTGRKVEGIEKGKGDVVAFLSSGERIEVEKVLVAVGRSPSLEGIDTKGLGLRMEGGWIWTNDMMETNIPGLYAIGDVTGGPLLAHAASAQGMVAVENALGGKRTFKRALVPSCIYTYPEVGRIGMTEDEAKRKVGRVKVGRFPMSANSMALIKGETEGFVKMIADERTGEILGVHMVGPNATELISELSLALGMEALAEDISRAIHPHPTISEAIMEAAHDLLGMAVHLP